MIRNDKLSALFKCKKRSILKSNFKLFQQLHGVHAKKSVIAKIERSLGVFLPVDAIYRTAHQCFAKAVNYNFISMHGVKAATHPATVLLARQPRITSHVQHV